MKISKKVSERFWNKVRKTATCWFWTAGRGGSLKYGAFQIGYKVYSAHRVSWILQNGCIPDGKQVNHHCDNPLCVRPDHLYLGTQGDNILDAKQRGRLANNTRYLIKAQRGEGNVNGKLTENDVREIRRRYAAGGVSMRMLADEFQIRKGNVCFIVNRKTWTHVKD